MLKLLAKIEVHFLTEFFTLLDSSLWWEEKLMFMGIVASEEFYRKTTSKSMLGAV